MNQVKDSILDFFGAVKNLIKEVDYKSFANSVKDVGKQIVNETREIVKDSISLAFDEERTINGTLLKDLFPNCTFANWIDDGVSIYLHTRQILLRREGCMIFSLYRYRQIKETYNSAECFCFSHFYLFFG